MTITQLFEEMGKTILEHKYRYYILADNVISDHEYDMLEREYVELSFELDKEPEVHMLYWTEGDDACYRSTLVGYPSDHPWAKEIEEKVNAKKKSKA